MKNIKNTVFGKFTDYFKEVIYGGIDGIVTTFAVVAGFAGASLSSSEATQLSFMVVLLFGLANLFADAASMGLGNFLSVRSEKDLYAVEREKELLQLKQSPVSGVSVTLSILKERGFSEEDARALVAIYQKNEEYWLDFMMHNEHEMPDPRSENEFYTGFATFLSFMIFGAIPLLPFMFASSGEATDVFVNSCIGTFLALVILGVLKWRVVGGSLRASLFEVVVVGGAAAVLAYFVGTFFAV